jgi:hypothetical protein
MFEASEVVRQHLEETDPVEALHLATRQKHCKAELLRLRAGYDGCGCDLCQGFYTILDLSKYGDRVKHNEGIISIVAGKTGADLWDEYHKREYWSNDGQVFFTGGRGYAVDSELKTVDIGKEADILKAFDTGEIAKDLCPGPAEVLQGILDYRKEIKGYGESGDNTRPTGKYRVSKARLQRAKPSSHARPKLRYVRSSKAGKGLSGSLPGHTKPGVSHRRSAGLAKKK